jgi:FkbM family methyltransferase
MNYLKSLGLRSLAAGLRLPEYQIDRMTELAHTRDLLRALEVNCVFDVGANRGQFASELRGIGYEGRIISFEPVEREFTVLKQTFANDANWRGYQIALGKEDSESVINVPRLTVLSSMLQSQDGTPTVPQPVSIRRMDGMFAEVIAGIQAPRVFLKMDTQGFDGQVFEGAGGCLAQLVGLESELSVVPLYKGMPHYLDALKMYEGAGFVLHHLSAVSRTAEGGVCELNCFMHRTGELRQPA